MFHGLNLSALGSRDHLHPPAQRRAEAGLVEAVCNFNISASPSHMNSPLRGRSDGTATGKENHQ